MNDCGIRLHEYSSPSHFIRQYKELRKPSSTLVENITPTVDILSHPQNNTPGKRCINSYGGCRDALFKSFRALSVLPTFISQYRYVLMYFLRGDLPWQGLKASSKRQKYFLVKDLKTNTSIEQLCTGFPREHVNACSCFCWFSWWFVDLLVSLVF